MGLLLFRAFLVINAFNIATENPVTPKPYRFPVYPVNECPRSENEFKAAAQRRNCTRGSRYLCAPNKNISSLIEFCTDSPKSLFQKGNCVLLEGTGDLDHYSCVEKFNSSCPSEYYKGDEIYKYPACLEIDKELRCFVADNNCTKREFPFRRASPRLLAIVYIIAVVSAGMVLIWVIFQKRRKEQGERYRKNDENKSLLKDPERPIEQNDDPQLDQAPINVSKENQTQTTWTKMLSETAEKDTQKSKTIQREEKQNEETGHKTTLIDRKQQDNPEIDDDKLRQFLSKGEITVCHVRCIIVGCGKAGKTTLLKRLKNVSFNELMQTERTEMVDFHVNSFEVLLEEETIQSVNKEDTLPTILFSKEKLEMALKVNAGKMTEETDQSGVGRNQEIEKSSQKNTRLAQKENIPMDILKNPAKNNNAEKEGQTILEPHSQDITLVQNQLSSKTNETHDGDIETNEYDKIDFEEYAILKIKDAVNELLKETDLRPRITFLDFAGQSMYYAFHQIFLRPKSCSILVVDMTKSLNDKVDVQDENEKECSQFASWRYRDYYKFWLKSIDSFSDTDTPVIIVSTHADKLSKEESRKFLDSLSEFFDDFSHSELQRHLNADRIYTIGFPETGSELEDLKDLKKCIADIVKAPCYLEENIRPVWALFEHMLMKIKETNKVISRKTLSDYSDKLSAQEFRMDDSEISKMLVFLHRVGILLYFDKKGLKENIILDIQWLLDAFKCIMKYPVKTEVNDMKRKRFYRTGELDDLELDRIWHIEGKNYLKHKTTITAYMQQLGLLTPLKELRSVDSTVYYFPSMNSKRFDKTGKGNAKSSILCFKFDEKLPINVFHDIVVKCSKLNNWSILTEGAKDNICLYQNAACFSFKKHVVVLYNCNLEIRVQVWALPKIYDAKLLKKIKHSVDDIIQEVERPSYEIGYKCRIDVLKVEEDVSFISHNTFPVSNNLCETCDVDKKHVVDNDICWELEVNDENQDFAKGIKVSVPAAKSSHCETSSKTTIGSPGDTVSKSTINSPDETSPKYLKNSSDETSPKSVINSSEMGHSSILPLNNDTSLDEDCIPSLNSEQRRLLLLANNEWTAEYGEKDENTKQPQNVKTKSMKEETKSIPIHNDESYNTTDSESSDDDDDYEGGDNEKKSKKGGVNAKRVDNLGIGTVMILDERTIQPEKVREKHVPVSSKPVEEKKQPIPVDDLEKLMRLKNAVGMIYGYGLTGTAFRVGADKIMTAWHFVREILSVGNLGDHAVFVDFNYEKDFHPDHLSRFPLEPEVLYYNEKLDIAVLQIKENLYGTAFPKPLEKFVNFTRQIHEKNSIYLIGHNLAGKKCVDHVLKYWDPLSHRIKDLYEWCEKEFDLKHGFGYTGIGDETRLHFQCMLRHGASGCPGFIVPPGGDAKVVTVLLKGFPDFYYFYNFTDEERERVPTEKLIQQGLNIDAIKKDMQIRNMNLYREIFDYREFISHSEKNKCIDTPSEEKVLNFPKQGTINTEPVDSKDYVVLSPNVCSEQNFQKNENMVILPSGGDKTRPITKNSNPTQDINGEDEEKSTGTTNTLQPQAPPVIGHQAEDEKPQDQEKCSTNEESEAGTPCNNAETTHVFSSSATAPDSTVTNQDKNEMSEREKRSGNSNK